MHCITFKSSHMTYCSLILCPVPYFSQIFGYLRRESFQIQYPSTDLSHLHYSNGCSLSRMFLDGNSINLCSAWSDDNKFSLVAARQRRPCWWWPKPFASAVQRWWEATIVNVLVNRVATPRRLSSSFPEPLCWAGHTSYSGSTLQVCINYGDCDEWNWKWKGHIYLQQMREKVWRYKETKNTQ